MIERVNVYVAALCGPKFVGGHGAWAYTVHVEAWDDKNQIFLPSKFLFACQAYLQPNPDQATVIVSYKAIIHALEWLIESGKKTGDHVRVYANDVRSISQLTRRWKPKGDCIPLFKKADYNRYQFQDIAFTWVGEEKLQDVMGVARALLVDEGVDPAQFPRNMKAEMNAL